MMDKETEALLEQSIDKDFKKIAKNYLHKLNTIMELTSDAQALYILNLTLKVIKRKFG